MDESDSIAESHQTNESEINETPDSKDRFKAKLRISLFAEIDSDADGKNNLHFNLQDFNVTFERQGESSNNSVGTFVLSVSLAFP